MKYIIYSLIILFSVINYYLGNNQNHLSSEYLIMLLLIIVTALVIKERYYDNIVFSIITYSLISVIVYFNVFFYVLLSIIAIDTSYKKNYYLLIVFSIFPTVLIIQDRFEWFLLIYIFSILLGYILHINQSERKFYIQTLDNERRLRYELEQVKVQLINKSHEIERITEIKERNRIAREIHDHAGHQIAGVLIQLQAAEKVFTKDSSKTLEIVKTCNKKLSETLELIRDTVYNIKPTVNITEKVFNDVINQFVFCKIDFLFNGNMNDIKPEMLEVILANLKESLTNASKYSHASQIDINIEANKNFVRFDYQDNGRGCPQIKEGLGLSGMKERVKNLNGMIQIDGNNGFKIIIIIPNKETNIFNNG